MIRRFIYAFHRITGTILSVLFLMWFLTGFVLIYHHFPRATQKQKLAAMDVIPADSSCSDKALAAGLALKGLADTSLTSLGLSVIDGKPVFTVESGKNKMFVSEAAAFQAAAPSDSSLRATARRWCDAPVKKIDTLNTLEQFIPFSRYEADLPIYKFYFDDGQKHQLYLSSITGEALQFTSRSQRIWAWLGPIPHWIYFTRLRQDIDLWKSVVIFLSAFGSVMALTGIYIGVEIYVRRRRSGKGFRSPYKKKWYWVHHVFGTFFGLFVLTWIFSGMMSLTDVPDWMAREKKVYPHKKVLSERPLSLDSYKISPQEILRNYPDTRRLRYSSFGTSVPLYVAEGKDSSYTLDARTGKPLSLTSDDVSEVISSVHGTEPYAVVKMDHYDNYYLSRRHAMVLPVYKVRVDNADNSVYYIEPATGAYKYFNTKSRLRFQLYQAMHSLRYGFLVKYPVLWTVVMWGLLLFGTLVSLSGVVLGYRYIVRLIKRR